MLLKIELNLSKFLKESGRTTGSAFCAEELLSRGRVRGSKTRPTQAVPTTQTVATTQILPHIGSPGPGLLWWPFGNGGTKATIDALGSSR
jgi:hypothetical protein